MSQERFNKLAVLAKIRSAISGRTPRWVPENAYELRKSDLKVRREMQAEVEKGWPEKP